MSTSPLSNLLLWFSIVFVYLCSNKAQDMEYIYHICDNTANYTRNSTYNRNLNTTLTTLPTTNSGLGYFNLSIGQGNDRVNSAALCRGDVNLDVCQSCLNDSIVTLLQRCPNQKGAIIYYDYCSLLYSNQALSDINPRQNGVILFNFQNRTMEDVWFNGSPGPLLRELSMQAAAGGPLKKFASRYAKPFYGLVQCSPDLSELRCSKCLENATSVFADWRYGGSAGGRILGPTCSFRYEMYKFFNHTHLVIPSPPPSSSSSPPRSTSSGGIK